MSILYRRRSRRLRTLSACSAIVALSVAAVACGDDDSDRGAAVTTAPSATTTAAGADTTTASDGTTGASSSGGDIDAATQAVIDKVFQTEMDPADVHPLIVEALARSTQELTPAQLDTAYECWRGSDCTVPGGGEDVLAIVDAFGGNTWRRISKMEAILQAMTYPEIGRIISSDANFDLPTYQSQVRGAVAQGANLVIGYNDFGDSMAPTFKDAQDAGAFVSVYVGPVPSAGADTIVTQIVTDTCGAGKNMAQRADELTGGSGSVAFFNGTPGNPQGAEWNKCALEAMEGTGVEKTFEADTSWTPAGAAEAAAAQIATGETVDAILYDYADPLPGVVDTYEQAGKVPPALVTWTMNNDLFKVWEDAQGTDNAFELYYTSGLNWAARVSVTAVVEAKGGNPSDAVIKYPLPFVPAAKGMYQADKPGDFPGTALVPAELLARMIG